jgi:hypothetical protein
MSVHKKINDEFKEEMDSAMKRQFGLDTRTFWSIGAMGLITEREDGRPFTKKESDFMSAFSAGYVCAMNKAE